MSSREDGGGEKRLAASMSRFLFQGKKKKESSSEPTGGAIICRFAGCGRVFKSAQGRATHELTHQAQGKLPQKPKAAKYGRAKILVTSPGGTRTRLTEEEHDERNRSDSARARGTPTDGVAAAPTDSSERTDDDAAGDFVIDDTAGGESGGVDQAESDEQLDQAESDEQLMNYFDQAAAATQGDSDNDVEVVIPEGPPPKKSRRTSRGRNLNPKETMWALTLWKNDYEGKNRSNKRKWAQAVADKFGMPSFAEKGNGDKRLRGWLKDEDRIKENASKAAADRQGQVSHRLGVLLLLVTVSLSLCAFYFLHSQGKARVKTGKHPEMEAVLQARVKTYRVFGLPVKTWTLKFDAMSIFHEQQPRLYPAPEIHNLENTATYPLKFSNTWVKDFMKRFNFSYRELGSKMNKKGKTPEMMETVKKYHIDCREFQLMEPNHPEYGTVNPEDAYSLDQVPIECADDSETTIDVRGTDEIYDATGQVRLARHFADFCFISYSDTESVFQLSRKVTRSDLQR